MSKRNILKKHMSKKYCGATMFDYLDDNERPLIYKAMDQYAKQEVEKAMVKKVIEYEAEQQTGNI